MRFLGALLLAWLACAATDTALTRAELFHRPADWMAPLQLLAAWAGFALLVAFPARALGRRLAAPFSACLALLAGPVVVHQCVRDEVRSGTTGTLAWHLLLGLALVVAGTWLVRQAEQRARGLRSAWPRRLVVLASLLLLAPVQVMRLAGNGAPATADRAASDDHDATTRPPNVLLLIWDTTRADHLQPWGYERSITPHLAELARTSLVFDNCWSASVFTLSSHVSMLTGVPPSVHGTTLRRQTVRAPTIASAFAAHGYRTGAFVGTSVLTAGRGIERGFETYDDAVDPPVCDARLWGLVHDVQATLARFVPALRGNGNPHWPEDFQRPATEVLSAALDFIHADDGRPWFAMINLFDAHWPYLPDEAARSLWVRPYDGQLGGYLFRADDWPRGQRPDAADRAHVSDLYDAELWGLDRDVDAFLGELMMEQPGTRLVMTADHGEGLGEAGCWSHDDLHAPQTHVPLLVHAPGLVTPGRTEAYASGIDVGPTLLALAGLPTEIGPITIGRPALDPSGWTPRDILVMDFDNEQVAQDRWAVIRGGYKLLAGEGFASLHDLRADPLDQTDLSPQLPELRAELLGELEQVLAHSQAAGEGDLANIEAMKALGYVGGH